MTVKMVALHLICADMAAQPRAAISENMINEFAADMARGDKFPALAVFREDAKTYWLGDGFTRYQAAIRSGKKQIQCDVRKGGLRDAILYSCGANAAHGLRRSNEDKRAAVAKLLNDPDWSKWSDREIAKRCCVGHPLVSDIRKSLTVPSSSEKQPITGEILPPNKKERTFRTKHGTIAKMKTSNIGKGKRESKPKPQPSFSPESASAPPPPPPVSAPQPAPAESNAFDRREELFGRFHDLAEELDLGQAQRLRALVNELAAEREDLLAFARATLAAFEAISSAFSKHKVVLSSPSDLQLIERWKMCGERVELLLKEKPGAEVPASAVPVADPSSATVAEAHAEPAGEVSSAPPAQDTPDDDDGLDIPESLRRSSATDGGLQPIGGVLGKIVKGIG